MGEWVQHKEGKRGGKGDGLGSCDSLRTKTERRPPLVPSAAMAGGILERVTMRKKKEKGGKNERNKKERNKKERKEENDTPKDILHSKNITSHHHHNNNPKKTQLCLPEGLCLAALKESNDEAKETDGGGKDLHDQDLDEEGAVVGISQGGTAAGDAHTDPAEEVGEANSEAGPEHGVAGEVVAAGGLVVGQGELLGKDDRKNDSVDGHGLAEHDTEGGERREKSE